MLSQLSFGLLSAVLALPLASAQCNGYTEYCTRSWSNITTVGSHDSPFVGDSLSDNQDISVTAQLDLGIRFLQGQTHMAILGDVLDMCHTSCLLEDAGTLTSYLTTIKTWLDANPNEVLTLLLTNGDYVDVGNFSASFEAAGLDTYCYVPPTSPDVLPIDEWPTLQEMIDNGTRLVTFLDYDADMSVVPYILDEFSYYFETPYDVTDATFDDCSINRPSGASADGRMYIVNHFLDLDILDIDIPDKAAAAQTNAVSGTGSIGAQASLCESLYGRAPNGILLDWVDIGEPIEAQDVLNGVST